MTNSDFIQFWKISADKDWEVAGSLFEKARYPQALFFGHLTLEKLLKAHWVKDNSEDYPPRTHNLVRLAGITKLEFKADDLLFLDKMNDYQMEGRYPDYNFTIYQICTLEFTAQILEEIKRLQAWLINQLP
ncbi:MAG: HEPN domain-containing protein [Bacteroidetes bacterium]|nr:HEPN domain-containing protein [Bacteroidota bacterium]